MLKKNEMKRKAQHKRKYIGEKKRKDKYMLMLFCTVTQEKKMNANAYVHVCQE
jgi:hypothetical protein